ncbi:GNAT family N-acetyltransferase [Algoriphagus jejuensis]|uniref:GNAT family N-acetyltransferase n=1 Tax=Algoriphagus jejuensis TaxID=419934 RepID=A0ABN1N1B0_9BACT
MTSVLDNPIWNALTSGTEKYSQGNDRVRYMNRSMGLFVGFQSYSEAAWSDLDKWFSQGDSIILFTTGEQAIPKSWIIKLKRPIAQMVFEGDTALPPDAHGKAVPLSKANVPAMLEITALTNPGPFFAKTIELGYYEGIFEGEKLVAMTGQRLHPDPYVEVSAVCTHPDFVGKGLAAELLRNQIRCILAESKIPFLHVNRDNYGAIRLYEKLGFKRRREMRVYFLEKAI